MPGEGSLSVILSRKLIRVVQDDVAVASLIIGGRDEINSGNIRKNLENFWIPQKAMDELTKPGTPLAH